MTKNRKNIQLKKNNICLVKNGNLLITKPPQRTPKLEEKPSALQMVHLALENMKNLYFLSFVWIIFPLLDLDPTTQVNADPDPKPGEKRYGMLHVLSTAVCKRSLVF
jgi:hypothetical protein